MQEFLLDAAAELRTLCSSAAPAEAAADGNGGGGGAKHARKRVRSLLLRMEGVVIGARTCLPDFEHSAPQGGFPCQVQAGDHLVLVETFHCLPINHQQGVSVMRHESHS